jgi:hypothetical protein
VRGALAEPRTGFAKRRAMKITLLGGGEVTGFRVPGSIQRCHVMVDCGLFQGALKLENVNRLPTLFPGTPVLSSTSAGSVSPADRDPRGVRCAARATLRAADWQSRGSRREDRRGFWSRPDWLSTTSSNGDERSFLLLLKRAKQSPYLVAQWTDVRRA